MDLRNQPEASPGVMQVYQFSEGALILSSWSVCSSGNFLTHCNAFSCGLSLWSMIHCNAFFGGSLFCASRK